MSGRRRTVRHEEEEHENHERWLVTYADLITLLMVLFIVMFSMSQVDQQKFYDLKRGLQDEFGTGPSLLDGGSGLMPDAGASGQDAGQATSEMTAAVQALATQRQRDDAARRERADLERARKEILAALEAKGLKDSVRFRLDDRGLVVSIVTDQVLFELGSAQLRPAGQRVLDAVGPALVRLPNAVSVEGHTDDLPISGRYADNWTLSTERATSVLRYLLSTTALPAKRAGASGFADQRPAAGNGTPAGRAANRRVEVVVLAQAAPAPTAVAKPAAVPAPTAGPAAPALAAGHEEGH